MLVLRIVLDVAFASMVKMLLLMTAMLIIIAIIIRIMLLINYVKKNIDEYCNADYYFYYSLLPL